MAWQEELIQTEEEDSIKPAKPTTPFGIQFPQKQDSSTVKEVKKRYDDLDRLLERECERTRKESNITDIDISLEYDMVKDNPSIMVKTAKKNQVVALRQSASSIKRLIDQINVPPKINGVNRVQIYRDDPNSTISFDKDISDKEFGPKNVIPFSIFRPGVVKTLSSRTHIDKFKIEQITLRRLRFLIESNHAQSEHLSLIDVIEQGQIPIPTIQKYFGKKFESIDDIRASLLKAIDRTRRVNQKRIQAGKPPQLKSKPIRIFEHRNPINTPADILVALDKADKSTGMMFTGVTKSNLQKARENNVGNSIQSTLYRVSKKNDISTVSTVKTVQRMSSAVKQHNSRVGTPLKPFGDKIKGEKIALKG